jgi:hypothetical protein
MVTLPHLTYAHFLNNLHQAGYTVIAVPFPRGFNHGAIAQCLLAERDAIRAELVYPSEMPHLWVGHSLGCKYIAVRGKIKTAIIRYSLFLKDLCVLTY